MTSGLVGEGEEVTCRAWHFGLPFTTVLIDRVRLEAPLGMLGRVAELVIGPYVRRRVERRNEHLVGASAR